MDVNSDPTQNFFLAMKVIETPEPVVSNLQISPLEGKADPARGKLGLLWSNAKFQSASAQARPNKSVVKSLLRTGRFIPSLAACALLSTAAYSRGSAFDSRTWPGGNIYYTLDSSLSVKEQKAFLNAAGEWAQSANLHFIARSTQVNYVTIGQTNQLGTNVLEGGVSAVGMVGGQQYIWISSNAWGRGIICHEIGHTLGLVHEQTRSDRDAYLTIITNNVRPGYTGLVKNPNARNQGPLDFLSIMMYAECSGSIAPPLPPAERYITP